MHDPCPAGGRTAIRRMPLLICVLVMMPAAVVLAGAADLTAGQLSDQRAEVLQALGLRDGHFVDLVLPDGPFSGWDAQLPFDDATAIVDLEPHSLRAANFRLLVQTAGGVLVEATAEPPRTCRGFVHGDPDSVAAVSVINGTLTGTIHAPSLGGTYVVQPVAPNFAGAAPSVHVVYHVAQAIPGNEECGVADNAPAGLDPEEGGGDPPEGSGVLDLCQIAFDADFEFFQQNGSSVPNTVADIENIMNSVDAQYDRDVDIRYEITTIIVRSAINDPYISLSPGTLLDEFEAEWNNNQVDVVRDTAHLMTGHDLSGSIIGIAHGFGFICDLDESYSLAQSRFTTQYNRRVDLTSHELGHIWDAQHCNAFGGTNFCSNCCTAPAFTMCSGLGTNLRNEFCPADKAIIIAHRNSRVCLSLPPAELTPPVSDSFDTTALSNDAITDVQWLPFSGTTVDGLGMNEPSGSFSLRLNSAGALTGSDQLRSRLIDASGVDSLVLTYSFQRKGGGDSPEPGDDLFLEYLDNTFNWQVVSQQPGDGPDMIDFELVSVPLPADALHGQFRLRLRNIAGTSGEDDWFVDDVSVAEPVALVSIISANPPRALDNPYQPGQPFRDVLDTGVGAIVSSGIGAGGTADQGGVSYAPIQVTFSGTPSPLPAPGNVTVQCTGGVCPQVSGVTGNGAGPYLITLDGAIPPGHCTTFTFAGTQAPGGSSLQYQSQPGNTNLDAATNTQDLLALIQALNDASANLAANLARFNIDRSAGADPVNTQDLLRLIQLLNGTNTAQIFNGTGVADCP